MFQTYLKKTNYIEWENQFLRRLNKNTPLKWNVIRGTNIHFVTKGLRKTIVRRSALKKKANNLNDPLAIELYERLYKNYKELYKNYIKIYINNKEIM